MDENVDVIVIGSGPAGCVAGAYLAKAGLKALVFEATKQVGGARYGEHEVAPGFLADDFSHGDALFTNMHNGAGCWPTAAREVGASIGWNYSPNPTNVFLGKNPGEYKLLATPNYCSGKSFVDGLAGHSPYPLDAEAAKELNLVLEELFEMPDELLWSQEMESTSFAEWLSRRSKCPAVKQNLEMAILMGCMTEKDILDKISVTSLVCILGRGWLNGMQNLSGVVGGTQNVKLRAFAKVITEHGSQVLLNHRVRKVIIENGEAKGVVVATPDHKEVTVKARYVVVATQYGAVPALMGEHLPESIKDSVEKLDKLTDVAIDVHLAMNKPMWTRPDYVLNVVNHEFRNVCSFAFPQFFDPCGTVYAPPGKQLIYACKYTSKAEFKKLTKEQWAEKMLNVAEIIMPGLRQEIIASSIHVCSPAWSEIFAVGPKVPMECPGISKLFFVGNYVLAKSWVTERSVESAATIAKRICKWEGKLGPWQSASN